MRDGEHHEEGERDEEERRVVGHGRREQGEGIAPLGHAEQTGADEDRPAEQEHGERAHEQRHRRHQPRGDGAELCEHAGRDDHREQAETTRGSTVEPAAPRCFRDDDGRRRHALNLV